VVLVVEFLLLFQKHPYSGDAISDR
jgi:hypothetical protein